MSKTSSFPTPRSVLATSAAAGAAAIAVVLAVLGGMALAQQDKYTLKVPDGLAFSGWQGIRRLAGCFHQSERQAGRCDPR